MIFAPFWQIGTAAGRLTEWVRAAGMDWNEAAIERFAV